MPMLNPSPLHIADPDVYAAVAAELARQQTHIELIASENFTYPAVLEAQGSVDYLEFATRSLDLLARRPDRHVLLAVDWTEWRHNLRLLVAAMVTGSGPSPSSFKVGAS